MTTNPDPVEPQLPSESGKAPKNRFVSFQGLHNAYRNAVREQMKNDMRFVALRGIYDLKPPEDPAYMRSQGMEDMPNFNLGEFKSKVDSYVSTWVDHNTGGYKFFDVKLKRKKENPPEVSDFYDEKATQFFNESITEWDDDSDTRSAAPYILESCVRDLQMGIFGIGIAYFQDDVDWRFCAIPTRKFIVPAGTKLTLKNCQVLFVPTETMTVTDLYEMAKDAQEGDGWNKKAVMELIYNRVADVSKGTERTFADWENKVRNNDEFLRSDFSLISLVDCYVQEFSDSKQKNGISHYIISESGTPTEILYKKDRQYKGGWRSIGIPFSDSAGPEGDFYGVKGFGDTIFENCDFQGKIFNDIARSAIQSNMPMWMTGSETDRDKVSQIRWTKNGIMNPGISLSQVQLKTDLNGMLGIFQASQRTVNTNTRMFPTGESLGQEAKTATQSTFDRQDQAKLSTLQIKFYRMVCLDSLGAEMYRRITRPYPRSLPGGRAAESFRNKCEEAGVPKDCYSEPLEVRADRTGGTGNPGLDLMVAKETFAVASPGRGQFNARREIAKSLVGSDRVIEFIQPEDIPQEIQGYIDLENSNLLDGQALQARPNQDHLIHLGELSADGQGHLAALITVYQVAAGMAKQGGIESNLEDAQKLDRVLEALLTHVAMHVQFLGEYGIKQYQEIAKDFNKTLNDIGQFLQTFREQIGAAMEAQQPTQPQMSAKDQALIISAQVKAQVEAAFAQQKLQFNQQNQDMKLGNLAERSAVKNELTLAEKQQQMQHKEVEFEQNLGIKGLDALTDAQIKAADAARTRAQANVQKTE